MRLARGIALFGSFSLLGCGAKAREPASAPPQDSVASAAVAIPAPAPSRTAPMVDVVPSSEPKAREEGIARGPLRTADEAIRAFRNAWSGDVTSALRARQNDAPLRRSAEVQVGNVSASMQPCRTFAAELRQVWAVQRSQLVFGSLDGLERPGQCWAVRTSNPAFPVAGYLSAIDGRLLLTWQIPDN